jgi:hypothetical protein
VRGSGISPTFTNGLKTDSIVATTALAIDTVTTGAVNIGTGASSKTINQYLFINEFINNFYS